MTVGIPCYVTAARAFSERTLNERRTGVNTAAETDLKNKTLHNNMKTRKQEWIKNIFQNGKSFDVIGVSIE